MFQHWNCKLCETMSEVKTHAKCVFSRLASFFHWRQGITWHFPLIKIISAEMCALQWKCPDYILASSQYGLPSFSPLPFFLVGRASLAFCFHLWYIPITSCCQKQHRCNVSCDGNVLNSGSKPARPSSFPPTRLHSVPALDFPDKSTLLYLMSSRSTFY